MKNIFNTTSKHSGAKTKIGVVSSRSLNLLQGLILFLLLALLIGGAFFLGLYFSSEAAFERDSLADKNEALLLKLVNEKFLSAKASIQSETAALAVESVRNENLALQEKIETLEKDINYYQRVLSPIKNDKGLRLDGLSLDATSNPKRKRLNVVLTQLGSKNRSLIKGEIKIELLGEELGEKKSYNLQSLKVSAPDIGFKFRFKYFQELNEEFLLPENFLPEQIKVIAKSGGRKSMQVEKIVSWSDLADAQNSKTLNILSVDVKSDQDSDLEEDQE